MAGDGATGAATVPWSAFETEEPELAAAVRSALDRHPHHVLGTLRADGSPRLSGTEVQFLDGDRIVVRSWRPGRGVTVVERT